MRIQFVCLRGLEFNFVVILQVISWWSINLVCISWLSHIEYVLTQLSVQATNLFSLMYQR